jgi:hypothetical protein
LATVPCLTAAGQEGAPAGCICRLSLVVFHTAKRSIRFSFNNRTIFILSNALDKVNVQAGRQRRHTCLRQRRPRFKHPSSPRPAAVVLAAACMQPGWCGFSRASAAAVLAAAADMSVQSLTWEARRGAKW